MNSDINCVRHVQTVNLCLIFVVAPMVLLAAQSDAPSIAECQSIQDDVSRLACFDRTASTASPAAEKAITPAAAAQAAVPPAPEEAVMSAADGQPTIMSTSPADPEALSDEIGRETVRGKQTDDRELSVRGRLVNCAVGRSGKYVFYFDNGQIWRQKDNTRVSWKECTFDVTISKDFFGYKMVRDSDERKVRIERVK